MVEGEGLILPPHKGMDEAPNDNPNEVPNQVPNQNPLLNQNPPPLLILLFQMLL